MWIDHTGKGNTLLILTDAESRTLRRYFAEVGGDHAAEERKAYESGIARGTAKMAEESKAEWKARVKK